MQMYARDHVEVHPQKKKEVLYLVKQQQQQQQRNIIMDINCELLLQEFNKYLLFFCNNTVDQLVTVWTNHKKHQFFFTEYIQQYTAAKPETRKVKVPGHSYFKKLDAFIESCMITGEMFHEYCENESMDPTPRPVPDTNTLAKYHYLPVAETSITNTDDSKRREVDDYRSRSKRVHKKNEINIEDSASVETFCNSYIVEKSLRDDKWEEKNGKEKEEFEREHN